MKKYYFSNEALRKIRHMHKSCFMLFLYLVENSDGNMVSRISRKQLAEGLGYSLASINRSIYDMTQAGYLFQFGTMNIMLNPRFVYCGDARDMVKCKQFYDRVEKDSRETRIAKSKRHPGYKGKPERRVDEGGIGGRSFDPVTGEFGDGDICRDYPVDYFDHMNEQTTCEHDDSEYIDPTTNESNDSVD